MKKTLYHLMMAVSLPLIIQTASAQVLFSDNYTATSSGSPNDQINNPGRQAGILAPLGYIQNGNVQIGNTGTLPIDPGDVSSGDSFLAAFGASAYINYDFSLVTGPLEIDFKGLVSHIAAPDQTDWVSFNVGNGAGAPFVNNSAVSSILFRANGGIELWNQGSVNDPSTGGFAPGFDAWTSYKVILSDTAGTGSAFVGNGTRADYYSNGSYIGTFYMNQLGTGQGYIGFSAGDIVGYDNVTISGTLPSVIAPVLATDIEPLASEVATGQSLTLSVHVTGTPLNYQWYNQNGAINGATTNSYSFNAVAGTNSYYVIVTNSLGSVTSSVATVFSATNTVTVNNFSFENDTGSGYTPSSWTAFNYSWSAVVDENGGNYPTFDPLAAPAEGNNFFACNTGPGQPTSGIYQVLGALQPNTTYTLTVALGYSQANPVSGQSTWSPGTISLINGNDNTGLVLATTNGIADTPGTWQDFSVTYSTGPSVSGNLTVELSVVGAPTWQAQFDNVRVTTAPAPSIIAPTLLSDIATPVLEVPTGAPIDLSVLVSGNPLSYQWYNQGVPISGATTNSYLFNAVAGINAYQVVVTNSAGSVTSSIATVISATNIVAVNNFSFENESGSGYTPSSWTAFNYSWSAVVDETGGNYSSFDPLADPAQGNNFFACNTGPGQPTSGIYQVLGALQPNTTYTLTVAIGYSLANPVSGQSTWSPGTISLINGTNNAGIVLATTNGIADTPGTWQDFSATFSTGPSVSGNLTVELSVVGAPTWQAQFDNVRVTTAPAPAIIPPALLADISSTALEVTTGSPVDLSVIASGYPLYYQWYNQGVPISGANTNSYQFNAVAGTNAYQVVVTNWAGSVTSSVATVFSAPNLVTVKNFSFEDGTGSGYTPSSWTAFNYSWSAVVDENGGNYPTFDPLAAPAQGNNFFACNTGPGQPTSGIYQVVGALQPNTTYTLTVAIGYSLANPVSGQSTWSPGTISLINGNDNTGMVLATTNGIADTPGTWQDFSATYSTGPSVSGNLTVELSVVGAPTWQAQFDNVQLTQMPVFMLHSPAVSGGNLILTAVGGTADAGYTLLSATNLTPPINWITNSTGSLDANGAYSNSIPIGTARGQFYLLRQP